MFSENCGIMPVKHTLWSFPCRIPCRGDLWSPAEATLEACGKRACKARPYRHLPSVPLVGATCGRPLKLPLEFAANGRAEYAPTGTSLPYPCRGDLWSPAETALGVCRKRACKARPDRSSPPLNEQYQTRRRNITQRASVWKPSANFLALFGENRAAHRGQLPHIALLRTNDL